MARFKLGGALLMMIEGKTLHNFKMKLKENGKEHITDILHDGTAN